MSSCLGFEPGKHAILLAAVGHSLGSWPPCLLKNSVLNLSYECPEGCFWSRLAALQSDAGKRLLQRSGRKSDDISSIVLVEEDGAYIKSDAVLRIGKGLGGPVPFFSAISAAVPKPVRDFAYDQVSFVLPRIFYVCRSKHALMIYHSRGRAGNGATARCR